MACVADFYVVGAMKAGTTSVYSSLDKLPDIFCPKMKEPFFFLSDFEKEGIPSHLYIDSLQEYENLYCHALPGQIKGDFSAIYLWSREAAKNIHASNPNAKIIAILRSPVDRAISHYRANVRDGTETRPIEKAFSAEINDLSNGKSAAPGYLSCSLYAEQLKRYLKHFKRDQVHIVLFETLVKSPTAELAAISNHIGANFDEGMLNLTKVHATGKATNRVTNFIYRNRACFMPALKFLVRDKIIHHVRDNFIFSPYTAIPQDTIINLKAFFARDIAELQKTLSIQLDCWK